MALVEGTNAVTSTQKSAIWVGVALIIGAGLYPPWVGVSTEVPGINLSIGHGWFFSPPPSERLAVNLDIPRLIVEWVLSLALAAGLYFAWPTPRASRLKVILGWIVAGIFVVVPILAIAVDVKRWGQIYGWTTVLVALVALVVAPRVIDAAIQAAAFCVGALRAIWDWLIGKLEP